MDITIGQSDIIDKNENLLIHVFFNLIDYDFRNGIFTNESSIYDMDGCNFKEEDYINLSKDYYEQFSENYSYSEGRDFYQKLSSAKFDKQIFKNFETTYGFTLTKEQHLLKDIILILQEKFPLRNWDTENIFILKTLNYRLAKKVEEDKQILSEEKNQKVVKLPVRKKLSPEEIKGCLNEYLMIKELGMTWEDAKILAKSNFDKKMEGKKFEPYLPETKRNNLKI